MDPTLTLPLPPASLAVVLASIMLTFLVGGTTYLMKRSLDQIEKITDRLNSHEVDIEIHKVRLDDHTTRLELVERMR